ncbi:MAG: glycosyltransferase family 2 protein [Anaerolineales bacterium]|nr:glycosyltransferase family 2 protein [Anaerolineales bacterium]
MYKDKTIAVVVPAYQEELLIGRVIETMPEFVDKIVIVDDFSSDNTVSIVNSHLDKLPKKIVLIRHEVNQGVGGAIATGYKWCRDHGFDVAVVMAGDAQMDPKDLPAILDPVVAGIVDFSKGNRLITGDAWEKIPKVRYLGNSVLSLLTKIASGYWHVADSQTGYTAINKRALKLIDWNKMYKRYGQPNDLLVRLNIYNLRVCDVAVTPVYNIGEKSGIKPFRIIPKMSALLFKLFLYRMTQKYIIRDFHPLIFFYFAGFLFFILDSLFLIRFFILWTRSGNIPEITALSIVFCTFSSMLFTLFAMLFDMEYNRSLGKDW